MAHVKKSRVLRMMFCDFCGRSQELAGLLIRGRDEVHICAKCVGVCAEMLEAERANQQPQIEPAPSADPQRERA